MQEIWIALGLFCFMWHLHNQRKMAEIARFHMQKYCDQNDLQFISIAKVKTRLVIQKNRGLVWRNLYHFEFSGDGVSCYRGEVTLLGTRIESINLPPYRVV